MALASQIVALALAAAQPAPAAATPAPAVPAADAGALIALFERVCMRSEEAQGFQAVQWSDFPAPLRLMNTYDHGGTFLKSETPSLTYIARTQGPGHMGPGIEMRCGIAARGADVAPIVSRLAELAGAQASAPLERDGVTMHMLIGRNGAFTVYKTEGDWVIVRSMGIGIPASMVRPRDLRRRGKRN
jgi:hypothetical protein